MNAESILSHLVRGFSSNNDHDLQGIVSEAEFSRLLAYERALADRHARQFALLIFSSATICDFRRFNAEVIQRLKKRMRMTDVAGWVARERVGALLPFSELEGARVLAESVCADLNSRAHNARCEVHLYPNRGNGTDGSYGFGPAETGVGAVSVEGDGYKLLALLAPRLPRYKRILDIAIASIVLVLASPLMLLIAALIKLVSPGPVIFKQERIGYLSKPFLCWKFRTMKPAADASAHVHHLNRLMAGDVPMTKLDHAKDPRVIPFGMLLRASGLDELPQLYNVLRGEMSFVGPRPCIAYEFSKFQPWHKRRFDTLPGLTGLWQVSGKNHTTFSQMMRFDVAYSQTPTLSRDLSIIVRTVPVIVEQVGGLLSQHDNARRQPRHASANVMTANLPPLEALNPIASSH